MEAVNAKSAKKDETDSRAMLDIFNESFGVWVAECILSCGFASKRSSRDRMLIYYGGSVAVVRPILSNARAARDDDDDWSDDGDWTL